MIVFAPLTTSVVHEDFAAVMRDIPALRAWSGQDWPTEDFTVDDNRDDLEWHERERREGLAFTDSVLLDGVVVGCTYAMRLDRALATRSVVTPPGWPVNDWVVRGWAHEVEPAELVERSMRRHEGPHRVWWQTNTDCPEQLDACDRLGLTDELRVEADATVWVLRSAPPR